MKKYNFYAVMIFTVSLLLVFACSKQSENVSQKVESKFKANKFSAELLASIGENKQGIEINNKLFSTAETFSEILKNKQISEFLVNKAKQDIERSCVQMKDIATNFPSAMAQTAQRNLTSDECEIEYRGHHYKIGFYVPNAAKADATKNPIIAAGFDVEDNEETNEHDIIFGWYLNEAGEKEEVNISENDAMNTDIPVIISTLEPCGKPDSFKETKKSVNLDNIPLSAEARATAGFFSNEYIIEKRYDGTTWSEFRCIGGAVRNNQNGTATELNIHPNSFHTWWDIADVHKNDIGKNLSVWKKLCSNLTPYWANAVVFNTFERDWYGSPKTLGTFTNNGITVSLNGNMEHSDNWYSFNPASPLLNIDLQYIHNHWADTFEFNDDENGVQKGRLKIWRVDN
jgi:hypothetical protein